MKTIKEIIDSRTPVESLTDDQIQELAYGIKHFCPTAAMLNLEQHRVWWRIAAPLQARLDALQANRPRPAAQPALPRPCRESTQLWEPGEHCGEELS